MKRTVDVPVTHSSFIQRVKHNGRGVLNVVMNNGKSYRFRAPIAVADQAAKIANDERSIGKWFNHGVKGVYSDAPVEEDQSS